MGPLILLVVGVLIVAVAYWRSTKYDWGYQVIFSAVICFGVLLVAAAVVWAFVKALFG